MWEVTVRAAAVLRAAARESLVDRIHRLAAALSYYAVFSIVPLLLLSVAAAGFLLHDPGALNSVVDRVTSVAGPEVGSTIESLLETVRDQRAGTLSVGIVLAAFTASTVFQQARGVLGFIFHVPEERRRTGVIGWLIGRVVGLASAAVLAVVVLAPIAAVGAVDWLVSLLPSSLDVLRPVLRLGIPVISVMLLMVVVGVTFQALTAVEIPWRAAVVGGVATSLLGLGAAYLTGTYLTRASGAGTLGALGGVAILLLFFYLMWIVYLFGAEVTKVYGDYLEYGDVMQPSKREARTEAHEDRKEGSAERESGERGPAEQGPAEQGGRWATLLAGLAVGWLAATRRRGPPDR